MKKNNYFLYIFLLIFSTPVWADFTGHDINFQHYYPDTSTVSGPSVTVTVGAGVEFPNPYLSIGADISANNIRIIHVGSSTWFPNTHNGPIFTDINGTIPTITGVTVNAATNMLMFAASRVSFTADSVTVNLQGLPFTPATIVSLDVQFAYGVGGSVTGLAPGDEIILQNNGVDDLAINTNGNFIFDTELADGTDYDVTILSSPQGYACFITNGTGTVAAAAISDIAINCISTAPVPTLSEWALILLSVLLLLVSLGFSRKQQN